MTSIHNISPIRTNNQKMYDLPKDSWVQSLIRERSELGSDLWQEFSNILGE